MANRGLQRFFYELYIIWLSLTCYVCLDFERLEQRLQSLQKDRLAQKHHLYRVEYDLFYCKD